MAAAVMPPMAPLQSSFKSSTDPTMLDSIGTHIAEMNHGSNLLVNTMAVVLRNMGYDDATLEKVSSRANANTIKATNTPTDDFLDDSQTLAHFIDTELLDAGKLRAKSLYINSNEPVLLLEASRDLKLSAERIWALKDNIVDVVKRRGIKPVRVYVRLVEMGESGEQQPPYVGIVLLNVVNTDIGGPSMVQLLDAGFHGREWKEVLVLKEGWNGEELLWRDEDWSGLEVKSETASVPPQLKSTEAVNAPVDAPIDDAAHALADAQIEESLPTRASSSQYKDVNAVPEDEDEDFEPATIEHPAMKELREREAQRGGVQHPTWSQMEDDPGLLDIITTQSSRPQDTGPVSIIMTQPADSSDDGFEVVEKA